MWHITNVSAKNFISFKSLDLDIPQDCCSLIYGLNEDNPKQKNNGTGKSSIIEAICFGLTGESLRGVKDGELINDYANKAIVCLTLENDYDQTLFVVERILDRDNPQKITCHKYDADDKEIQLDRTVQPTVLDYNRYILEEIGLSKDDLFSNYILSNSKYESFFNASDKSKKAMINHFSGADAVDNSIEALKVDMIPANDRLQAAHDGKIAIEAKIEAVNAQIADANDKKEQFAANKELRIQGVERMIAEKREELRNVGEQQVKAKNRIGELEDSLRTLDALSDRDSSLSDDYKVIEKTLSDLNLQPIKDYVSECKAISESVSAYQDELDSINDKMSSENLNLVALRACHVQCEKDLENLKAKYADDDTKDKEDLAAINEDMAEISARIKKIRKDIDDNSNDSFSINEKISNLQKILFGVIECPACGHKFLLSGKNSYEEVEELMKAAQQERDKYLEIKEQLLESLNTAKSEMDDCEHDMQVINTDIRKREEKLTDVRRKVRSALSQVEDAESRINMLENKIKRISNNIETEQGRAEGLRRLMFDDAVSTVETAIGKGKNYVASLEDRDVAINSAIATYEASIKDIMASSADDLTKSLEESKERYTAQLSDALNEYSDAKAEYDKLALQETHFNQFKSHLANKKIEAISGVTNSFLEKIGSDLRVELLGFKVLKTGKLRDKITVNLLRNGVPCGSYAKFSGGERARVNLASILALQKLTNNACPEGKGLDITILDEVLEASDSTGIESCCNALNKLAITSLLVTQNPVVDHDGQSIVVVKENGYSYIKDC